MRQRLLLVLAPSEEERRSVTIFLRVLLGKAYADSISVELFDAHYESSVRYHHFSRRLEALRSGYYQKFYVVGSRTNDRIDALLRAVPQGVLVGNFATSGSFLDRAIQSILHVPNRTFMHAQGKT